MRGSDNPVRKRLRFYGQVQGVGFRWRARVTAERLGLTGWVENLWDGSVQMEVQGYEEGLELLLQQLEASPYIHIENFECLTLPIVPGESNFLVKGY